MNPKKTFDSPDEPLQDLLRNVGDGKHQLPDFQRGWVWDDGHIKSLLASISLSYPIGAVMMLQTGNEDVRFKPRLVEGVNIENSPHPERFILDGQQRLTALFQSLYSGQPVHTKDERGKLQENEFFANRDYQIALAPTAAKRKKLIEQLPKTKSELWDEYEKTKQSTDQSLTYLHESGQYPLMGRGDTNYYAVFAERALSLLASKGYIGLVVPSGIATDNTSQYFLRELVNNKRLLYLIDFENRKEIFEGVHRSFKFILIGMTGKEVKAAKIVGASFLHTEEELHDPDRIFELTHEDFAMLNPNTKTAPVFRTRVDAELTKRIYKASPVLIDRRNPNAELNPWGIRFLAMFHMTNDSGLFKTKDDLEKTGYWLGKSNVLTKGSEKYLPLYEGKMVQMYDHRAATVIINPENLVRPASPKATTHEEHRDPDCSPLPQFWVPSKEVESRLIDRDRDWYIGYKDVTAPTNRRSMIAAIIPKAGAGNKLPFITLPENLQAPLATCLLANLCSFCLDYAVRQKIGGQTLNFFIVEQLPILPPDIYRGKFKGVALEEFIAKRVLELTYTSWDVQAFAKDLGYKQKPFAWDEERRLHLRCQLDALFFHLYGLNENDAFYILETFPVLQQQDVSNHGSYRTKDLILAYFKAYAAGNMDAWVKE